MVWKFVWRKREIRCESGWVSSREDMSSLVPSGGGGGGGFVLACQDLGRMFGHSFPACPFFKVEISSSALIPFFKS